MPDVAENASDPPARALRAWTPLSRALTATGDHWTLSIVLALAPGRMRLTHLHKRLPGISTGVLERGLQQMVALGLVTRTRFKEMPPRVELELTATGSELLPIAGALARWGMRHMWSAPRAHEQADVDVLLRLLPALLAPGAGPGEGCIDAVVTDADPPIRYRYRAGDGGVQIEEQADRTAVPDRPMAKVRGSADAWIAALGPSADRTGLHIGGDEQLARSFLAGLPGPLERGL